MNFPTPLQSFIELVATDPALRAQLVAENDHGRFAELCVTLGASRGLTFTAADVRQWQQQVHLAWLQRNLW